MSVGRALTLPLRIWDNTTPRATTRVKVPHRFLVRGIGRNETPESVYLLPFYCAFIIRADG